MPFDVDLFVIGGGSGGVRAARMAAAGGARVALAESSRLGSRLIDLQSQNMTVAASATADRKVLAHLS